MEDIKEVIQQSNELLNSLYDKRRESKEKYSITDDGLRESVISFMQNQFESIKDLDTLKGLVISELVNKIALHELETSELQSLFATISNEKSKNTDTLLSLFRPTSGVGSTLIAPPVREDREDSALELTSGQRQGLAKLGLILDKLNNKNSKEEE